MSFLTLHVGAGTFKPVLVEKARSHEMHAETFQVSVEQLQRLLQVMKESKPIVVVGTTSCRTLEILYWCGVKILASQGESSNGKNKKVNMSNLVLGQFEWQEELLGKGKDVSREDAFETLIRHAAVNGESYLCGRTSLMISPDAYSFRVVEHLVTNFHAPDSTLMLLVASFLGSGEKVKALYDQAAKRGFHFLSYGDVCFLSRLGCMLPSDADTTRGTS